MFNSYKPSARGTASTGSLLVLGHRHSATQSLKGFIRAQVVAMMSLKLHACDFRSSTSCLRKWPAIAI
ncbi:unnamed protein product [Boreogadus saida]